MTILNRRAFLQSSSSALFAGCATLRVPSIHATPTATTTGLPLGLQLYSVRALLPLDFAGTLRQIAALGYQEVEAAGYFHHSVRDVGSALEDAGLRLPSAHYSHDDLNRDFDRILEFNKAVGVHTLICSFPGLKNPSRLKSPSFATLVQSFTLDDWRWNADEFNRMGQKAKAAGMRFGYHNHTMEFRPQQGIVPYEELMQRTDPSLVTFELDCGWVIVGGGNPVALLERYPTRITMLHVKDFKRAAQPLSAAATPPAAELGRGTIDYRPIFAAARRARIRHCYVEQEEFDMPPMQSL
ncbi:MAG TPA: sugar phosphate isomerase/epimerase, partial [Terracidiphilus sp.]|nr:sugar phosphate isomerase/epimerase [Terracidiphilus sp.]